MDNQHEFSRQAEEVVRENQHLRVKSDNDDKTIHLMRQQYDAMALSVDDMRSDYERKLHHMRTERDQAVARHAAIKALLLQAANIVMQALRADIGNETPEKMPPARLPALDDGRLPIARLG